MSFLDRQTGSFASHFFKGFAKVWPRANLLKTKRESEVITQYVESSSHAYFLELNN